MEILKMQKSLRSVRKKKGVYEYLRVNAEEAEKLVDAGKYIYVSKEDWRRVQKFYNEFREPSKKQEYIPCTGTLINKIDTEGNKIQESLYNLNYTKNIGRNEVSSTKISKFSSTISAIKRRNKYAISHKGVLRQKRFAKRLEKVELEVK